MNATAAADRPVDLAVTDRFARVRDTLQGFVDAKVLPGVSVAVLRGHRLAHKSCVGWADMERRIALRDDHIFRVFSNTKLVTACAALLLVQDGRLHLDEPIGAHLPTLSDLFVLRENASRLDEVEPARRPVTARHLLTHTAGFTYAHTRSGTLLGGAYATRGIPIQTKPLGELVRDLGAVPLMFEPGTAWEYSVCSDVLARLIEVLANQSFSAFLRERIFAPLGMYDTAFWVAPPDRERLTALYQGRTQNRLFQGGLERCDDLPYPGAYLEPIALCSGGGGLVSTLDDMTALVRSLISPRHALLRPEYLQLLLRDQLPADMSIQSSRSVAPASRGFSFGGAVTRTRTRLDPPGSLSEVQWGGIAGTHWWVSPATGSAAVIMTHRYMSFWHLFAFQARREIYAAL
jgi:CubicO group peptidase (beta-lactamase class C family)